MFLGLIVLNPTPLFLGKRAEWGLYYTYNRNFTVVNFTAVKFQKS